MNDILYHYDFVVVTVLRILFGVVGRAPQRTYDDIDHAQLYNLVQHNLSCFARSCSKKANPNQRAAIVASCLLVQRFVWFLFCCCCCFCCCFSPVPYSLPLALQDTHVAHHQVRTLTRWSLIIAGNEYSSAAGHPNQPSNGSSDLTSPTSGRYAHNFYPSYPQQPGVGGSSMPSVHDAMDPMHSQASTLAAPASAAALKKEDEEHKRALFGDVPESKRRKFILVDDNQRGTRVRVRVMLDQVKMDDMPDAHLRINAVYPRSYFPRQMRSPPGSPGARGNWDDEDDEVEDGSAIPPAGKTMVPVSLMDGSEAKLPVPRMTKSRRNKEVALNELGYRMSWGQARTFNGTTLHFERVVNAHANLQTGRTLFLQRSLDAYRNKMRSTMIAGGSDTTTIAPHFETRPGKRKWLERNKRARRGESL